MKKSLCILILVAFGFASVFASGTEDKSEKAKVEEAITLEVWDSSGLKSPYLVKLVEVFEKDNPNIKINRTSYKNYDEILEKALARVATGRLPDIFRQGLYYTNFVVESFSPVPLDDFIAADKVDLSDFPETVLKLAQYDGKQVGLVFQYSVPLNFFNKDAFKKAGIEVRDVEYSPTIDEIEEWSAKLTLDTNGDGQMDQWGINYPFGGVAEVWRHQALIQTYGGTYTTADGRTALLDTEPAIQALDHWGRLALNGYMPVITWKQAYPTFKSGKIAIVAGASTANLTRFIKEVEFDMGTYQMAHAKKRSVPAGGNNVFILSKDPDKQRAAWEFVKWLTSPEGTTIMSKGTGYMPVRKSALRRPELMGDYVKNEPRTRSSLSQVDVMTPWYNWPGGSRIQYMLKDSFWEVMLGKKTTVQASKDVNKKVQAVLDEYFSKK